MRNVIVYSSEGSIKFVVAKIHPPDLLVCSHSVSQCRSCLESWGEKKETQVRKLIEKDNITDQIVAPLSKTQAPQSELKT